MKNSTESEIYMRQSSVPRLSHQRGIDEKQEKTILHIFKLTISKESGSRVWRREKSGKRGNTNHVAEDTVIHRVKLPGSWGPAQILAQPTCPGESFLGTLDSLAPKVSPLIHSTQGLSPGLK